MTSQPAALKLTVEEAAVRKGVSLRTLYKLRERVGLRTYRRPGSRRVYIDATELDAAFAAFIPVGRPAPAGAAAT